MDSFNNYWELIDAIRHNKIDMINQIKSDPFYIAKSQENASFTLLHTQWRPLLPNYNCNFTCRLILK